jgi:hypothetical protein
MLAVSQWVQCSSWGAIATCLHWHASLHHPASILQLPNGALVLSSVNNGASGGPRGRCDLREGAEQRA